MGGSIRWVVAKLTIFTAVTVAITIWLAAVIGNFQLFSSPYELQAEFKDATGLLVGDVVKAAGVTVGRVNSIKVDDGIAKVTLSIRENTELPAGLTAQIRFRNLLGQRMISLAEDPDLGFEGLAQPGENIPLERTRSAFDLTVLFNGLRPLIRSTSPQDINIVSRAVVEALEGRGGDVESLLANVADITEVVAGRDEELSEVLDSLNIVTTDLSNRDAQLRSTLADIRSFVTDLAASRADLAAAVVSLDDAAGRFGRIIRRNDDNISGELKDLAVVLDAVNDKRAALRTAVRRLPKMLVAVERVNSYGQWSMLHLIDVCKDDLGTCGTRGRVQ